LCDRPVLKKAGKFFEKSQPAAQPAGFFQDFADCPNPASWAFKRRSKDQKAPSLAK
jgi:hypothetical protein